MTAAQILGGTLVLIGVWAVSGGHHSEHRGNVNHAGVDRKGEAGKSAEAEISEGLTDSESEPLSGSA